MHVSYHNNHSITTCTVNFVKNACVYRNIISQHHYMYSIDNYVKTACVYCNIIITASIHIKYIGKFVKIISEMQHCQKYVCSIGVGWNKYVYAYYRITVLGKHNSPSGLSFDQLNPIRCNFIYHRWKNSQNAPFNKKYVQLLPNICNDLTNICNAFLFFWNTENYRIICLYDTIYSNKL